MRHSTMCFLWGILSVLMSCDAKSGAQVAQPAKELVTPKAGPTDVFDLGNRVKLEMAWIPPGTFTMGSPSTEENAHEDEIQHHVQLTKGYWLGKTEVTQAQWEQVMGTNPSANKGQDLPVENVSWKDCKEFIQRLNARLSGKGGGFRLPTEAEWEYACRAGGRGRYCFGDNDAELGVYAWYEGNSKGKTKPVGTRRANALGLYDMHGNVREWCEDSCEEYRSGNVTDPLARATHLPDRITRGGSYDDDATYCRSAYRGDTGSLAQSGDLGFRLARTDIAREKATER